MMFLASLDQPQDLSVDDVSLRTLLSGLVDDVEVVSDAKSIRVNLDAPTDFIVKGDAAKLRTLFLNLVENALRYTAAGGRVAISLGIKNTHVAVSVADTGIGIPEEHLPHIFERFYRVDKSRSRAEGGVGLGLAIAKRIAELHAGRIEVQSKVGEGSTFAVFLPLDRIAV
jgi:signal transduction histidine kinase